MPISLIRGFSQVSESFGIYYLHANHANQGVALDFQDLPDNAMRMQFAAILTFTILWIVFFAVLIWALQRFWHAGK